jgi:hypothetical protein
MAERDYSADLPMSPPDDIVDYVIGLGYFAKHVLVYKMEWVYNPLTDVKERMVWTRGSCCGEVTYLEKVEFRGCNAAYAAPAPYGFKLPNGEEVISDSTTLCPNCADPVLVLHVNRTRQGYNAGGCYPMTITRIENKIVLIGWYLWRCIDTNANAVFKAHRCEAYVIESKRIRRLTSKRFGMFGNSWLPNWEQRKKFSDEWQGTTLFYPWDPDILIGSTAENSKLDILIKDTVQREAYPVTYLSLWLKYPQIENLVMQGASKLLSEMMCESHNRYLSRTSKKLWQLINWKEAEPAKMFGMTRPEFRTCVKENWDMEMFSFWTGEKQRRERPLTRGELILAKEFGISGCRDILLQGKDWIKVVKYLNKQKSKDSRNDLITLKDYWRIAQGIGEDMTVPEVEYPPNLIRAHDRVNTERIRLEQKRKDSEIAARKEQFEKRYKELSIHAWESAGIFIRPVKDEAELIREGKQNKHCISSYAKSHASGGKSIFLIRHTNKPKTPWYTLELNAADLKVVQNRGKANCAPTLEVENFTLEWLKHIKMLKSMADKKQRKAHSKNKRQTAAAM